MGQRCPCREIKDVGALEAPDNGEVQTVAQEKTEPLSTAPVGKASVEVASKPKAPRPNPWILPAGEKLTVMMFGMTGAGKSALGNLIAGAQIFDSGDDTSSITNLDSIMKYEAEDNSLIVLDTIGLGDTEIDQDKVVASIRDVAVSALNGVDCLLYVMRNARITDDAIARLIYVTEYLWGDESLLNLYIVVTCASKYARSREDAEEWIQRQVEINWRFKHIYSIVGNNPSRFVFVDNPDPESQEPNLEERRALSREAIYKLFCTHPRAAVPPFTQEMMKKVQELTKQEREELHKKEEEVKRLETEVKVTAKSAAKKTVVTGVVPPAEKKGGQEPSVSANLRQAKEDMQKAKLAMQTRLNQVKSNKDFQAAAEQHAEKATSRFLNDYKSIDQSTTDKGRAASRMLTSLSKRLSMNSATAAAKSSASKTKAEPVISVEEQLKKILKQVKKSNKEPPAALFRTLGGWSGPGAISPLVFTNFLLTHVPDVTQSQIGALWWRADTNGDGQVDLQEFKDFFTKYVEVA
mmetsp:Transcript_10248/g.24602  ORF Transcript_10248/g.24602 Transcript_10248/m.24602 type:complete len:522 (-) Transcript_10248:207-1772(-)